MNLEHLEHRKHWYVAATLLRAETAARHHLRRQGFEVFCPYFRKVRRHARKVEQILAPVFPGYLFVSFDPLRDQWRSINGTIGVRGLIGFTPSRPQPMPVAAMAALFERCELDVMTDPATALQPGQQVRVLSGPFANHIAEIVQLDDRGRVRVLLDLLGGQTPVAMHVSAIGPL